MNPAELEKAITAKTRAIIPVHLFGQPADMDPILEIARCRGLFVVEDACQAHGAEYKGRRAGSLGDAGCFSFYPGKNLGAFGEGGGVVTNNPALDEKIRVLRDHGQVCKYYHSLVGWNCRMDAIQAAVLRVKLRHLERANQARRCHAGYYDEAFRPIEQLVTPFHATYSDHVYHIYAVRVPQRDRLMKILCGKGVGCAIHYPVNIHRQDAYRHLDYPEDSFPVAERCASEFVSLPMFPELTVPQLEAVCDGVKEAIAAVV